MGKAQGKAGAEASPPSRQDVGLTVQVPGGDTCIPHRSLITSDESPSSGEKRPEGTRVE